MPGLQLTARPGSAPYFHFTYLVMDIARAFARSTRATRTRSWSLLCLGVATSTRRWRRTRSASGRPRARTLSAHLQCPGPAGSSHWPFGLSPLLPPPPPLLPPPPPVAQAARSAGSHPPRDLGTGMRPALAPACRRLAPTHYPSSTAPSSWCTCRTRCYLRLHRNRFSRIRCAVLGVCRHCGQTARLTPPLPARSRRARGRQPAVAPASHLSWLVITSAVASAGVV
jgi:hypothetical protein